MNMSVGDSVTETKHLDQFICSFKIAFFNLKSYLEKKRHRDDRHCELEIDVA